jgi:ubiquinone biosynthesis monooxygenase Coq7
MPATHSARNTSPTDQLIEIADQALRTLFGKPQTTGRPYPAQSIPEANLSAAQRDLHGRLMRINHTGEICAQGLYQGQALTARTSSVQASMQQAAAEENDHLAWCEQRIQQLGGRLSLLNPIWFTGSFLLGACAGALGDRWSLGFVAETERQVEGHLDKHLLQIAPEDQPTRSVLQQMQADETAHGEQARQQGGVELPLPIRLLMKASSRVMTTAVYYC